MRTAQTRRLTARTAALLAGLACSTGASAQDYFWLNAQSGNWNDVLRWSPAAVPNGMGQSATINATGAAFVVNLNINASVDDFLLDSDDASFTNTNTTLTMTNSGVFNRGAVRLVNGGLAGNAVTNRVGFEVVGSVNFTLNSFDNEGVLSVLGTAGTNGTLNLNTTAFNNSGTLNLNSTSNGAAIVVGSGTLTNNGTLNSLEGSGSARTISVASIENNGDINISANTTFNFLNGETATNATGSFNTATGFTALFNNGHDFILNGGTIDNQGGLEINGGNAVFTFNGGTITGNNPRVVNAGLVTTAAGTGSVDMIGNTTLQSDAAPGLNINVLGTAGVNGTMNMGASNFVNNAVVNLDSTSNGAAIVIGTGTLTNNGTLNSLQGSGSARTISVASFENNSNINISANTLFNALNGSTTTNAAGSFNIASSYTATFNNGHDFSLNGGTVDNLGAMVVSGTNALLSLNGGLISNNMIEVQNARLATTAPTFGGVMVTGNSSLDTDLASGLTVAITGLPGVSSTLNYAGNVNSQADVVLTSSAGANGLATLSGTGAFTNAGSLAVLVGSGSGRTISVTDFNNQGEFNAQASVAVNLNSGTLDNNGTLFIAPAAIVSIGGGGQQAFINTGTVSGDGTLDLRFTESFTNNGVFDPQGSLSVLGAWSQSGPGDLAIAIGGTDMGISYDLLTVSLAAAIAGDLEVTLAGGFVPAPTDVFTILTASSITGFFANGMVTLDTTDGSGTFDIIYNPGSVQLTNFVPVPSPASAAVLAMGGLLAARRRRA
jgi:hypothetical protein